MKRPTSAAWYDVPHATMTTRSQAVREAGVEVGLGQGHRGAVHEEPAAEGVRHRARLLVDLLEHEVAIAALLGHGRVPVDPGCGALDAAAVEGHELGAARG